MWDTLFIFMSETEKDNKKVYASIAQLCKEKGIDRKVIRAASAMGLPGFNANRTVSWNLLEPALKENEKEIALKLNTTDTAELTREKLILKNEEQRLKNRKLANTYVDPTEWYQWHSDFGAKLSTIAKTVRKNLMAKCVGYEAVIDNEMLAMFVTIQKEIESCKQQ